MRMARLACQSKAGGEVNNPKFSIGQHVAVCTAQLNIVIPATVITGRKWTNADWADQNGHSVPAKPGWLYLTSDCERWLREKVLRPIDPDTEYQDEQEREVSL
jgi:hypothetical protein